MNEQPKHVAIIMDGNGRWATQQKMSRAKGHRAGVKAVKTLIESCLESEIEVLTLFAFGLDNHHRPGDEVKSLMGLFAEVLSSYLKDLHKRGIRIRLMGDRHYFNDNLLTKITHAESHTAGNCQLQVVLAINYSGQWEIVQAAKRVAQSVVEGKITVSEIDEETMSQHLCFPDLPPPDLFIRTSGEQRLSNFMLWQLAYAEMYFTDVYWPDFDASCFAQALAWYKNRDRRFGLTREQKEEMDV